MQKDITLIYTYRLTQMNQLINTIPPLGIYSISSYVNESGFSSDVKVVSSDLLVEKLDEAMKNSKIIGFSCYEDNYPIICNAIKYIKRNSDCKVFVGGPQTYSLGEKFLLDTGCDIIMKGDGEYNTKTLIEYYVESKGDLGEIKGISFLHNEKYVDNGIAEQITDLDSLPFANVDYEKLKSDTAYIITGRGCPFNCAFCFEGYNTGTARFRSVENVIAEIESILERYPNISMIQFLDDTFTINIDRLYAICDYFIEVRKKRNIKWMCEAHVGRLHQNMQMIDKMIESGLVSLQVGIESGSDKVLKAYNKRITADMIVEVTEYCKEKGLENLQGNIIIGGAYESEETINDDISMLRRLIKVGKGMIELNTTYFWPFPNTDMTIHPEKYDIEIIDEEVNKAMLSMRAPVTKTADMDISKLILSKKKMDMLLSAMCKETCLEMSIDEIKIHWKRDKRMFAGFWGLFLQQFEHIVNAMLAEARAIKDISQYSLDEVFTIRTFLNLQYKKEQLCCGNTVFNSISQIIIENSNGKMSLEDIKLKYNIDKEMLIEECQRLRDKCFIYFSLV